MNKIISTIVFLVISVVCHAQNINIEQLLPGPEFQDADVGDIELFDFDNDGDLDFIATGKGGPVLTTLYTNDGSGNFTEVTGTPFINVFGGAVGIEDVNNDGFLDLLITGNAGGGTPQAHLYINDTLGNFTLVSNTPFQVNWGGDVAFSDVDNDGDQDVILTGEVQMDVHTLLYLNDGTGVFTVDLTNPFEQLRLSSVEFIDIDNDGDEDVLMSGENSSGNPSTTLYTNDGTGNFALVANTPLENCFSGDIAITDSDNDGDLDIFLCGDTEVNGIVGHLYTNDGAGSFSLVAVTSLLGIIEGEVKFADFDNDNDQDIFIIGISEVSGVIGNIYENQGGNNFVLADEEGRAYISSIAIGDIDGDNYSDVIIGGTSFTLPVRATKTYINQLGVTGINDSPFDTNDLRLFPNPARNLFQIEGLRGDYIVQIINATGKVHQTLNSTLEAITIDIEDLPTGLYFVTVFNKSSNQLLTQKILKY